MQWPTISSCLFSHSDSQQNCQSFILNIQRRRNVICSCSCSAGIWDKAGIAGSIYTVILKQKYSHSLLPVRDILICYLSHIPLSMTSAEYPTLVPIPPSMIRVRFEVKILEMMRVKTEAAEMKLLRPLAGYTLYDHKTNNYILRKLRITGILDKIDEYRRNWLSHLQRMP